MSNWQRADVFLSTADLVLRARFRSPFASPARPPCNPPPGPLPPVSAATTHARPGPGPGGRVGGFTYFGVHGASRTPAPFTADVPQVAAATAWFALGAPGASPPPVQLGVAVPPKPPPLLHHHHHHHHHLGTLRPRCPGRGSRAEQSRVAHKEQRPFGIA